MRRLLDQDPRREVRRQGLILDRIEIGFRNSIAKEIRRASLEMADFFEVTGEVGIPRDHVSNLENAYLSMAIVAVNTFGARVFDHSKNAHINLERKDFSEIMTRLAFGYIGSEAIRKRITAVADTTRNQIIRAVASGFSDGLGQRGVAGYIRDLVPSFTQARAGLIARTETHGAAQFGANEAAKETGLKLRREWISAEDNRTRDTHAAANGQIVGQDETFDIGDSRLMFPGDPNGEAAETINCRCVIGFVVIDS